MSRPVANFKFKKSAFLECYHHLLDSKADIDFLWGGRDSGKSRFIASMLIIDCLRLPYFRCVLARKVYSTILGSQFQLIQDVAKEWKIDHLFHFVKAGCKITCKLNGNTFEGRGMDDPQKLKSFSNPSHCWAEEMSDFTLDDFIVIITSLRYNEGKVKLWCSFNPEVDGEYTKHWLYKFFFDRKDPYAPFTATWRFDETVLKQAQSTDEATFANLPDESEFDEELGEFSENPVELTEVPEFTEPSITQAPMFQVPIATDEQFTYQSTHTTYKDNKYCRPERRAILEAMRILDPFYYQVYTQGKWGRRKLNDPFAHCYSIAKHSRTTTLRPDLEIVLSFDFNKNPITCGVYQYEDNQIWGIETIQLEDSNTYRLCDRIRAKYSDYIMLVTGDATGANSSTLVDDNRSNYTIIQQELGLTDNQMRVPLTNPVVKKNRVLLNACLHKLDIALDPKGCDPLHFDLQNVACNEVGDIDKGTRSNPKKRADHLDHFRYFLNTFFYWVLKM